MGNQNTKNNNFTIMLKNIAAIATLVAFAQAAQLYSEPKFDHIAENEAVDSCWEKECAARTPEEPDVEEKSARLKRKKRKKKSLKKIPSLSWSLKIQFLRPLSRPKKKKKKSKSSKRRLKSWSRTSADCHGRHHLNLR